MNLATAIALTAGGPGSGCKGDNCGRPAGSGSAQQTSSKTWKTMSPAEREAFIAEHTQQGTKPEPAVPRVKKTVQVTVIPGSDKPLPTSPKKRAKELARRAGIVTEPQALGNVGFIPLKKGQVVIPAYGVGKSQLGPERFERAPKGEVNREEFAKNQRQWKDNLPAPNRRSQQEQDNLRTMEPGDTVMVQYKGEAVKQRVYDRKWGKTTQRMYEDTGRKEIPVGRTGQILVVKPSTIPGRPAEAMVKFGRLKELYRMPLENLHLVEKAEMNKVGIEPEPVYKGRVLKQYTAHDGADVTIIKPSRAPGESKGDGRGSWKPSSLWGKFKDTTGVMQGLEDSNRRVQVYFAKAKKAQSSELLTTVKVQGLDIDLARSVMMHGTTVFVHRWVGDSKRALIQEISTDRYGHPTGALKEYKYSNLGAAANFAMRKYGIALQFPKTGLSRTRKQKS